MIYVLRRTKREKREKNFVGGGGGEILIWRGKREKAHSADSAAGSNPWLVRALIG